MLSSLGNASDLIERKTLKSKPEEYYMENLQNKRSSILISAHPKFAALILKINQQTTSFSKLCFC